MLVKGERDMHLLERLVFIMRREAKCGRSVGASFEACYARTSG